MLVTIKQYAEIHHEHADAVQRRIQRGRYETAVKLGRDWFIDSEEVFVDQRFNRDKVKVEVIHE